MYRGIIPLMNKGMRPLILEVKTDNAGTSTSTQFTIPTTGTGYSYSVKTSEQTIIGATGDVTLSWASAGTYDVEIYGDFPRIFFNNSGDRLKLLKVKQWGELRFTDFSSAFFGCSNMDVTATDMPRLNIVTSLNSCFRSCSSLVNNNGSIGNWNISNVSVLSSMFNGAISFNKNIGNWNVSNVNNFALFMAGATSFNNGGSNDIVNWNLRTNVSLSMSQMFLNASSFNQNISSWNVISVSNMNSMFNGATAFNQNLGNWRLRLAATSLGNIFENSGMSTNNYTDTIVGWANYVITNSNTPANISMANQTGRTFQNSRSGGVNFATAGDARTYLTTATPTGAGWTITGDTVIP